MPTNCSLKGIRGHRDRKRETVLVGNNWDNVRLALSGSVPKKTEWSFFDALKG